MQIASDLQPIIAIYAVLIVGALAGIWPVKKIIVVAEAKHELKEGSAGFLRSLSGWTVIVLWLAAIWFAGTVLGDWYVSGDLALALDRAYWRLRVLVEILEMIGAFSE